MSLHRAGVHFTGSPLSLNAPARGRTRHAKQQHVHQQGKCSQFRLFSRATASMQDPEAGTRRIRPSTTLGLRVRRTSRRERSARTADRADRRYARPTASRHTPSCHMRRLRIRRASGVPVAGPPRTRVPPPPARTRPATHDPSTRPVAAPGTARRPAGTPAARRATPVPTARRVEPRLAVRRSDALQAAASGLRPL